MKTAACFALLSFVLWLSPARAAEPGEFAAVRAADERRIEATIAGDTLKLAELLSDDLHYAHSDGRVQTKAQFIEAVAANKVKYLSVVPRDVTLQSIAPGAVTMHGRARLAVIAHDQRREFTLQFLAVWREEAGHWRLLAYQSSPLPESQPNDR